MYKEKKRKYFYMDGIKHRINLHCHCAPFGKKCKCGGFMHYQPVYGGYYYECDECHIKDT